MTATSIITNKHAGCKGVGGGQNGGYKGFSGENTMKKLGKTLIIRLLGVQKVRGSNPLGPTIQGVPAIRFRSVCAFSKT